MERIWLDPQSSTYVQRIVARQQNVSEGAAARIARVRQVLDAYHTIDKTDLGKFPIRIDALERLGKALGKLLLETDFGGATPLIQDMIKRCAGKAEYLRTIMKYYEHATGELINPALLIDELTAARQTERTQRLVNGWLSVGTKNINLDRSNRMEKLDPAHRNWGLKIADGTLVPEGTDFLSLAASQWAAQVTAGVATKPLFLWLEGKADLMGYGDQDVANSVHAVPYYEANAKKVGEMFWVRKGNGRLEQAWLGDGLNLKWQPFDTTTVTGQLSSKGKKGTLAYVFNREGELFAALHNPIKDGKEGVFHHSSFTGGGAVKCAGMIGAKGGLVTYVDNDSGHYKPSGDQLKAFVAQLISWKVNELNMVVHNAVDRSDASPKQFMQKQGVSIGMHRMR